MAAGDTYTILRPKIMIAPLLSPLPVITKTGNSTWGAAWSQVKRTGNGAVVTVNAPMQDIVSDEVGVIGVVSAGTENVNIAWQTRTPDMNLYQKLSHFQKTSVVQSAGPPVVPQHDNYRLQAGSQPFMVGLEGYLDTNGLVAEGGKVYAFGYHVIQTENTQMAFRTSGNDAIVTPSANVRCLPTTLVAGHVTGSNLVLSELDEKFNLIVVPNAA